MDFRQFLKTKTRVQIYDHVRKIHFRTGNEQLMKKLQELLKVEEENVRDKFLVFLNVNCVATTAYLTIFEYY